MELVTIAPRDGYSYLTRHGRAIGPVSPRSAHSPSYVWQYEDFSWTVDGHFWERLDGTKRLSDYDLVAELPMSTIPDGRPANWTEARALVIIADPYMWQEEWSDALIFAKSFNEGDWSGIRRDYPNVASELDAP